eukprot:scaffold98644_cov28-Tisochrysis_lutea.AAC.2
MGGVLEFSGCASLILVLRERAFSATEPLSISRLGDGVCVVGAWLVRCMFLDVRMLANKMLYKTTCLKV